MRRILPLTIATSAAAFALVALLLVGGRGDAPAAAVSGPPGAAEQIARAEEALRADPSDADALANLAAGALARVKETADSAGYVTADRAARRALALDPGNVLALESAAALAAARHRFDAAIAPARRAGVLAPGRFAALETLTDAYIELGRYEEGFATAERRLALRPDLSSYSRASYAAELRGDHELAVRLMELAADAGRPGSADRIWAQVQLGLLHLSSGDADAAGQAVAAALRAAPDDPAAVAAQAHIAAARGDLAAAAAGYRSSLSLQRVAHVAVALAEVELVRGDRAASRDALALAREIDAAEERNGVLVALDAAAADADFARPDAAAVAAARAGHRLRGGVVGDDALGWVLTRAGRCDEGLAFARRSLRLGTRDALMHFHAGMAARCAGHPGEALRHLRRALAINGAFSVRWAPVAKGLVADLAAA